MKNPLLENYVLPPFTEIKPAHIEPAIDTLLDRCRTTLDQLLDNDNEFSWDTLIKPLEDCEDVLNRAWSPIGHLHSVADNDELRGAFNACLPKLSEYSTELGQNENLYKAYLQIFESDEFDGLVEAQKKIIENSLRDFRLSGIGLEKGKQNEFKQLKLKLSKLQTRFEENVLDATNAWEKIITSRDDLAGLPDSALLLAAQLAKEKNQEGWLFTLDFPSYFPVMSYAENEALREEMYEAYTTRASEMGPHAGQWDNSEIMFEILQIRNEMAELLAFHSYAEYSLEQKMANTPEEVLEFLHDLAKRSKPMAKKELAELETFAKNEYGVEKLNAWDIVFYSEKLRQHLFKFSQEDLRPYFPVPNVLKGLFAVVNNLYGLKIKERKGIEVWNDEVVFFDIFDSAEILRGSFYLDLYARKNKRGGAWMDECVVRKKSHGNIQTPVAYLTCNFTPPVGNDPSLLTHDEVITLFHEFGHGLHHMLTQIDYSGVSGINGVPWDAVELPSQFMENWCWERESLDLFAMHYKDGTTLPNDLYEKMLAAKSFQSGMQMLRQLEFALFDFHLHYDKHVQSSRDIQSVLDDIRTEVAVIQPPAYNRFQHGFGHIFAGGYAAGYYSYKWAEVLSADAFSKFEENGIFDRNTGLEFLHSILERGGSREPMDLFIEFRGRRPSINALLRHSGIIEHE